MNSWIKNIISIVKSIFKCNFTLYSLLDNPDVFVSSNSEGIERVEKADGKYAFFMESSSIQYIIERNCAVTQIGGTLDTKVRELFRTGNEFNSGYFFLHIVGMCLTILFFNDVRAMLLQWSLVYPTRRTLTVPSFIFLKVELFIKQEPNGGSKSEEEVMFFIIIINFQSDKILLISISWNND